jgi:hypothetical protein
MPADGEFSLDSSVALAWVYAKETTVAIQSGFASVRESGTWVPGFWKLEVANILEVGVRRYFGRSGFIADQR